MTRRPPAQRGGSPAGMAAELKRGQWTPEEDELLAQFVAREGEGRWRTLPRRAGLQRCGKSCRLRWMNYLRPSIKRGPICHDEEDLILRLHRLLGNRWSLIAGRLPGRTDNEIKNYWNTHLSKKLVLQGIDPRTHRPLADASHDVSAATKKAVAQPPVHQSSSAAGDHHDHEPNGGDGFARVISLEYGGDVWCDDVGGVDGFGGQFWRSEAAAGGGGGDVITMDDGAFSSFLESLINDDCIHAGEGDGDQEKCGENDRVGTDAVSGHGTLS